MDKEAVVYIHNGILLGHEKEWNHAICNNVDVLGDHHSKWSMSDKYKHHMTSLNRGIYIMTKKPLIYKTETDSQKWKTNLNKPQGKGGGGMN